MKLRAAAKAAGIGPGELATILGVDQSTVHRWYKGALAQGGLAPDGLRTCLMLLRFGVSPASLVGAMPESSLGRPEPPGAGNLSSQRVEARLGAVEAAIRRIEDRLQPGSRKGASGE